jgi:two-component system, NtrC family, response regulator HydG
VLVVPAGPEAEAFLAELHAARLPVVHAAEPGAIDQALALDPSAVVVDLDASRLPGLDLIARAADRHPHAAIVALVDATRADADARALEAMEKGATDVLPRPASVRRLRVLLKRAAERRALVARAEDAEANLAGRFALDRIVGQSPGLTAAREALRRASQTERKILLLGEPGTGKELFARVLLQAGRGGRFLEASPEGLGGVPEGSDLPGVLYITGLDEPTRAAAQAVRLWFGPSPAEASPASWDAAGPRGLLKATRLVGAAVTEPSGVADAFEVTRIALPPLRERAGDVPLLVDHFLRELNREHARRVTGVTRGALAHLEAFPWPGNVRQLLATLEGMVVFAEGRRALDVSDLPLALRAHVPGEPGKVTLSLAISLAEAEKRFLEETLRDVGYDRPRAAETLGIGLRTLYRKLKEYEIG